MRPAALALVSLWLLSGGAAEVRAQKDESPPTAYDLGAEARRLLREGDLAGAARPARLAVEIDPDCAACWALLGTVLAQSRDFVNAEGSLERALSLGSSDPSLLLTLGSVQWENGQAHSAETTLAALAQTSGRAAELAQHQLARLWLWQGSYLRAAASLEAVVAARPEWSEARLDLARALDGAGRPQAARSHYEAYLRQAPDDGGAVYGLALLLRRSGDLEEARRWLERYDAMRSAERASTLESGRRQAELDQAHHLLVSGRPQQALQQLEGLAPDATALGLAARARRATGDVAGALQTLERAVALDPSRTDLRSLLQQWYLEPEGPS